MGKFAIKLIGYDQFITGLLGKGLEVLNDTGVRWQQLRISSAYLLSMAAFSSNTVRAHLLVNCQPNNKLWLPPSAPPLRKAAASDPPFCLAAL